MNKLKALFLFLSTTIVFSSCQKNNIDSAETLESARLYMTSGNGVEQNFEEGVRLFHLATEQGNTDAMWELGLLYEYGNHVDIDVNKAFQLYKRSSDSNNAIGHYLVAHCYQHGISVEEDLNLANEIYKKSFGMLTELAKDSDRIVLNFLGSAYFWGDGVAQDQSKGFEMYLASAKRGNPETQYKVGWSYEKGLGVEKDLEKAIEWYRKSANQGYPDGIKCLEALLSKEDL